MNLTKHSFIKNLSVAFIANLVSLLVSSLLTLVLPKFIGVSQYAYYQLYVFYASYVGFLGFGWIEGIYLRYGGEYYSKIDKSLFSSQLRLFIFFEAILSIVIFTITVISFPGIEKTIVYISFGVCIIIYMPRALLHNLLQTTGRIKEYAIGVIIEKAVHILIITIGILMGQDSSVWFISSELLGRSCAAIYIFYICRDLVFAKPIHFRDIKFEVKDNISCGLVLMVSNVASMLIIGVMRQAIVIYWDVETFGKISLTLSISNLLLIFINSIALVLFPMLKRSDKGELAGIYGNMRTALMVPILFSLVFYYPVKTILSAWLPQYAESLKYMAILFPMCVYESKISLLINTFMKALRKEKILLLINIGAVICSFFSALLVCRVIHSLDLAIVSIVIILIVRCVVSEIILRHYININIYKDIVYELILTSIFILVSWFIGGYHGVMIYLGIFMLYFYLKKNDIIVLLGKIKK
nr:hypothetical protein [uncultured Anaerosporobacter sp.]